MNSYVIFGLVVLLLLAASEKILNDQDNEDESGDGE